MSLEVEISQKSKNALGAGLSNPGTAVLLGVAEKKWFL